MKTTLELNMQRKYIQEMDNDKLLHSLIQCSNKDYSDVLNGRVCPNTKCELDMMSEEALNRMGRFKRPESACLIFY